MRIKIIVGGALIGAVYAMAALAGVPYGKSTVAVGTTSTAVLSASPARTVLILQNDSDTTIYCNLSGGAAVVGQGTRLSSTGGGIVLDVQPPADAVACIHGGSGSKNLLVTSS